MKKIMLVSILLAFSVLAYSQEVQGIWETQIQIYDGFEGINTTFERIPDEAISIIQFDEEFGTVTFRSGRESRFIWETNTRGLSLNYLTEKQGIYIASAQSFNIEYSFVDEETLVLKYTTKDIFSSYLTLIMKRVPSE